METSPPFFSIITVAYKDSWALTKTARSVFRQQYDDIEYLVIDGASDDGTAELIEYWRSTGLIDNALIEPDSGVYDAMNKGLAMARGQFVCFLNTGDIFAHDNVLRDVRDVLESKARDGCMGWGELNGRVWAAWHESAAFRMSSLGFCHQALFVKREKLLEFPFDARPIKTDSDTFQLASLYDAGAEISIVPEVWAVRGGEPGISANLERTKISICDTLVNAYPVIEAEDAEAIISFRRGIQNIEWIENLLASSPPDVKEHLALMVLDTLFQPASGALGKHTVTSLRDQAISALQEVIGETLAVSCVESLLLAQTLRSKMMAESLSIKGELTSKIDEFRSQEDRRYEKIGARPVPSPELKNKDYIVALTSFPARLQTVDLVVQSLVAQSVPPQKILLVLGKDEIPGRAWLSKRLSIFEEHGLEVVFAEKTHHQYDKYLHTFSYNENMPYVIVDDDVIYPNRSMEHLLAASQKFPDAVIGNRCHLMGVSENGTLEPYRNWVREQRKSAPAFDLMPTGAGGVLYPKGFFSDQATTSIPLIMENAPYADDIWLKFCALKQGRPTYATELSKGSDWYLRYTPTMREGTLMDTNVDLGLNDIQISKAADWLSNVRPDWKSLLTRSLPECEQ